MTARRGGCRHLLSGANKKIIECRKTNQVEGDQRVRRRHCRSRTRGGQRRHLHREGGQENRRHRQRQGHDPPGLVRKLLRHRSHQRSRSGGHRPAANPETGRRTGEGRSGGRRRDGRRHRSQNRVGCRVQGEASDFGHGPVRGPGRKIGRGNEARHGAAHQDHRECGQGRPHQREERLGLRHGGGRQRARRHHRRRRRQSGDQRHQRAERRAVRGPRRGQAAKLNVI